MGETVTETVDFDGIRYTTVKEGQARILTPYRDPNSGTSVHKTSRNNNNDTGVQAVFYNKIQQFNRDLTILAILIHGEGALAEKSINPKKKHKPSKKQKNDKRKATTGAAKDGSAATNGHPDVSQNSLKLSGEEGTTENIHKRKRDTETEAGPTEEDTAESRESPSKKTRVEDASEYPTAQVIADGAPNEVPDNAVVKEENNKPVSESHKTAQIPYTILDALSATGLRALRYAKEIPFATRIVANDLLPEAVKSIEKNVKFNELEHIVTPNLDDARVFMYGKVGNEAQHRDETYVHRFDVVDLDPYGTAAPFLDAAIQALQDGGLLCVTCTDAGVFASNGYPEKAYSLYAGTTMKGVHSHEAGLRLILHAIALSAAKYGIAIEPLLSLSIDFYARVFIRIHKKPGEVKLLAGSSMLVYNCDTGCGAWTIQKASRHVSKQAKNGERFFHYSYAQAPSTHPHCEHCGFKTHLAGPMWAGPLHNPYFLRAMIAKLPSLDRTTYGTVDRMEGMLKTAIEEDLATDAKTTSETPITLEKAKPDASSAVIPRNPPEAEDKMPFFFIPGFLAKVIHVTTPSEAMLRSAFISSGYRVTRSHCKAGSFKTNAPWNVIWEIFREFARKVAPQKEGALKSGTAGYEIMKRTRGTEAAKVLQYKEELLQRLSKATNLEDLKAEMEGGMFRLGQLQSPGQADASNGIPKDDVGMDNTTEKRPDQLEIVFDEKLGKTNGEKLVRYQINMPHWGPMNRATGRSD